VKKEILVDASSLILLHSAGMLADVCLCYDVLVPSSVYEEITVANKPGAEHFQDLRLHNSFQVLSHPVELEAVEEVLKKELLQMGKGERHVLAQFLGGRGSFPVVDDRQAARFCVRHEIPFINALLVPKILYWAFVISEKESGKYLSLIEKRGWYSSSVLKRAKKFSARDLQQFFP
jgi:hypothetical protein